MTEPIAVESRRAADERVNTLRARYGAFPTVQVTFRDDPERFRRGVEQFHAGFRGAARVRVEDDDGRVLLIREGGRDDWGLPGGGNEPAETLAETARRETFEEAGVETELTGVWAAARRRYVDRETPERRGYLLSVVFEGRRVGGQAGVSPERLDDDERVLAADWFETPPPDTRAVVAEPTAWEPLS